MVLRDRALYECVFAMSISCGAAVYVFLTFRILPSAPVDGGAEHTAKNGGEDRRACAHVVRSVEWAARGQAYYFSLVGFLEVKEEAGYEDGREARTERYRLGSQ